MKHSSKPQCKICHKKTIITQKNLFDDRYGAKGLHSITTCSSCGYGQTKPGIKRSQIGNFYAKHYPLTSHTPETVRHGAKNTHNSLQKWMLGTNNIAHHSTQPGEAVLDIGSGSGISLLEIDNLGGTAYGVEPDPTAQILAKPLKLKVYQGFITDNPFPRKKFDLITASQVIEHEPDPLEFLIGIKKKLKKNGRIILSFPNHDALYRRIFGRRWIHWHVPYHLNFFTRKSFSQLTQQAGLKIVKLKTITPNVWTLLQLRMNATQPAVGEHHPVWDHSSKSRTRDYPGSFLHRFSYPLSIIFFACITPVNRLIDSMGMGESFWIELGSQD